jgi:serine/threonine protein kinase
VDQLNQVPSQLESVDQSDFSIDTQRPRHANGASPETCRWVPSFPSIRVRSEILTGSSRAQEYIRSLPFKPAVSWKAHFPQGNAKGLDLLAKLLSFDPSERISCEQALEHPYLAVWHDPNDEPSCPTLCKPVKTNVDFTDDLAS